jgi:hypothetical protein
MTTVTPVPSPLPQACEAILEKFEMYSQAVSDDPTDVVEVFDVDGELCFRVTPTISEYDLRTVLNFARGRYNAGEKAGREAVAAGLRVLIGAAKAA